jgi:hypothetical protein
MFRERADERIGRRRGRGEALGKAVKVMPARIAPAAALRYL